MAARCHVIRAVYLLHRLGSNVVYTTHDDHQTATALGRLAEWIHCEKDSHACQANLGNKLIRMEAIPVPLLAITQDVVWIRTLLQCD